MYSSLPFAVAVGWVVLSLRQSAEVIFCSTILRAILCASQQRRFELWLLRLTLSAQSGACHARGLRPVGMMQKAANVVAVWLLSLYPALGIEEKTLRAHNRAVRIEAPPASTFDSCSNSIQSDLKFDISGRTPDGIPVAIDDDESLADAVCCDQRVEYYAEPQFLYEEVDLFGTIGNATTTFFDSVCGLPLFTAPLNRSMSDFQADTREHGWPSFRSAEVNFANVLVDSSTGLVTSSCGTHLGTFLPDAQGDRWCIDLSCIAGRPNASVPFSVLTSASYSRNN